MRLNYIMRSIILLIRDKRNEKIRCFNQNKGRLNFEQISKTAMLEFS